MENEFSNFGKTNPQPNNANFSDGPAAPPRSWISRNWLWFVPLLLVLLVSPCICCGGFFFFAMGAVKSSVPYKQTMERVSKDPQVIQQLGQPIEQSGWSFEGHVNYNGQADFDFDVAGPKGTAHVHAVQVNRNGNWIFEALDVTPTSTGKTMSLLSDEKPDKPDEGDAPIEK